MIQLKGYLEQLRSLLPPEPGKRCDRPTEKVSRTSDVPALALKNSGSWEMYQEYVELECYREELEADIILSTYLL